MQFTNKQEYLAAVAQWKLEYAALSKEIRDMKIASKKEQREKGTNWNGYKLVVLARKATEMISARHSAKQEAQEQYLAQRSM